jgi:replicative DNA helicase
VTTTLEVAQYYASRGWAVFPLKPKDKKPLKDSNGFKDATTDPEKLKAWWGTHPDYNLGIATGETSGLLVIDIDMGHDGEESLTALETEYGPMPKTITARTGGGGRHLLYKMPDADIRISAGKLGKGLDIRANGGYIAAAPSLHPSGARYVWIDQPSKTELAAAPEWLVSLLLSVQKREFEQVPAEYQNAPLNGAVVAGSRNATMASLAGTMRRRGMSEQSILSALEVENKTKCKPPLSRQELDLIAKSVCRYEPTAAPNMQNGERIGIEWAFCKVMFEFSELVNDFTHISPDLFQDENLRKFWQSMLSGLSPDKAAAEAGILLELEKAEGNADHLDIYVAQISKFNYSDGVYKAAKDLEHLAKEGDVDKIHAVIDSLFDNKTSTPLMAKNTDESLDELEESLRNGRQFIKTRIGNLDQITGGLERRTLSILAARPSMGKTTLAWQIARNVAASGGRVLFLSLEVSGVSLWRKAALGLAEIDSAQLENNKVPQEKMEELYSEIIPTLRQAYSERLFIHDTPPFTTGTLWKISVQTAPDLIIIDHLAYVEEKADNEVIRLGIVTKWAKRLAKKTNSHVMVLHQLNRGVEQREHKEPMLSDLRDSGHVEQDSDTVFMPYRSDYYTNSPVLMRYSETNVFIRKNRDGRLGVIGLYMDMLHQWFYRKDEIPANWQNIRLDPIVKGA